MFVPHCFCSGGTRQPPFGSPFSSNSEPPRIMLQLHRTFPSAPAAINSSTSFKTTRKSSVNKNWNHNISFISTMWHSLSSMNHAWTIVVIFGRYAWPFGDWLLRVRVTTPNKTDQIRTTKTMWKNNLNNFTCYMICHISYVHLKEFHIASRKYVWSTNMLIFLWCRNCEMFRFKWDLLWL